MKTFYIIQMMDGRYVESSDWDSGYEYCQSMDEAGFFSSEEEAIEFAPSSQPFTIIKFYDK